jgi:hypothetical protein
MDTSQVQKAMIQTSLNKAAGQVLHQDGGSPHEVAPVDDDSGDSTYASMDEDGDDAVAQKAPPAPARKQALTQIHKQGSDRIDVHALQTDQQMGTQRNLHCCDSAMPPKLRRCGAVDMERRLAASISDRVERRLQGVEASLAAITIMLHTRVQAPSALGGLQGPPAAANTTMAVGSRRTTPQHPTRMVGVEGQWQRHALGDEPVVPRGAREPQSTIVENSPYRRRP